MNPTTTTDTTPSRPIWASCTKKAKAHVIEALGTDADLVSVSFDEAAPYGARIEIVALGTVSKMDNGTVYTLKRKGSRTDNALWWVGTPDGMTTGFRTRAKAIGYLKEMLGYVLGAPGNSW